MSILGDRIKTERERLGLIREDLGHKLGVSYSTIAMYEQGNREPNNDTLLKLSKIFNCSLDYLLGVTSNKNPKELLEERLKNLNIDEAELKFLKELFKKNSAIDISLYYMQELSAPNSSNSREIKILNAVLGVVLDYIPEIDDTVGTDKEELELNKKIENNLIHMKKLISSLDENKIIPKHTLSSQYYMCPVYGRISAGQPNWTEECIEGRLPIDPVMFNIVDPEDHFFLRVSGESMNKIVSNGAYALIRKQDMVENGEIAVVLVNGDEATLKKFSKQGELVVLEPMSDDNSFEVQVYDKTTPIKILGKYVGKFEMNK